jgi:hypothetical protein
LEILTRVGCAGLRIRRVFLTIETTFSRHLLTCVRYPSIHPARPPAPTAHSLKLLDTTPSRECHKIGVIYVAAAQDDQRVILRNERGSPEYEAFVDALGWPVDVSQHAGFLGGLDPHGATGRHTPYFATSAVEMIFHVATRMPTVAGDPQQVHKKRQVGNDHVHIVWSDSSRDYLTSTISSHFNDVHIVIYPLAAIDAYDATLSGGCGYFRVAVHRKEVCDAERDIFHPIHCFVYHL